MSTYIEVAQSFRSALLASQKTITVQVSQQDLAFLKTNNYKLCFAKKVGDADYNVVWQSYTQYLMNNEFSWTPQYQLFGTNTFHANVQVRVSTNTADIGLGEQSTLDANGILSPASTGGPDTAITMINDFGTIHPGINQLSTGLDGTQVSTPIYVAVDAAAKGKVTLTPRELVLVWFEQNIETSTMFSTARTRDVEIDMTFVNNATRLYNNQAWSTPGA